jgi:hypothetical protein
VLDGFGFWGNWVGLDLDAKLINRIGQDMSVILIGLQWIPLNWIWICSM